MKAACTDPRMARALRVAVMGCACAALTVFGSPEQASASGFDPAAYTRIDAAGNRIIHLPPGVYDVSRTVVLPSNTRLEGEGESTVLKAAAAFTGPRFITNADFARGDRNIIVRNLKIDFPLRLLHGEEIGILRFKNIEALHINDITMVLDSELYGIDLSGGVRGGVIEGCTIRNANRVSGGGIMIRNSERAPARAASGITVRDNRIQSASDEPIAVFGWEGTVEDVAVENNTVDARSASFGITVFGIDERRHRGSIRKVRIAGNRIRGGRVGGIGVKGGARSIEVSGNTIEDTTGDGIFLHSGGEGLPDVENISVKGNTVLRAGRHCILAAGKKISIAENRINGCEQSGVYAAGDVSVSENDITDAKPGILVEGGTRNSIRGNSLHNSGEVVFLGTGTPGPREKSSP